MPIFDESIESRPTHNYQVIDGYYYRNPIGSTCRSIWNGSKWVNEFIFASTQRIIQMDTAAGAFTRKAA